MRTIRRENGNGLISSLNKSIRGCSHTKTVLHVKGILRESAHFGRQFKMGVERERQHFHCSVSLAAVPLAAWLQMSELGLLRSVVLTEPTWRLSMVLAAMMAMLQLAEPH